MQTGGVGVEQGLGLQRGIVRGGSQLRQHLNRERWGIGGGGEHVGVKPNHQPLGPFQLLELSLGELIACASVEITILQFLLHLVELEN